MHPAITLLNGGETRDYRWLDAMSNRTAHLMRQQGLRKGDAVALLMENSTLFLALCWGAQRAGLYYVCLSTKLLPDEVEHIITDAEAELVFVDAGLAGHLPPAPSGDRIFCAGGGLPPMQDLEVALAEMPETPITDEMPGRDMLYSSGTTGRPKGVRSALPGGTIAEPEASHRLLAELYNIGADDVYLSPAPLYHAAPLRTCMATHRMGGHTVVMQKFDPEAFLAAIERYRVTVTQVVPTMFARLIKLPKPVRDHYDLSSLRVAVHAAAPCPVDLKRQMLDWWGPIIHEYYSATELAGLTAIGPDEWLRKPGSVGRAVLGEPRIVGEDGELLPPGQIGLIHFRGGPPFEYHRNPAKTASVTSPHGVTFGDVGYLDDEGYLFLTDRQNYMIVSGGVNIYPQEAENALLMHPDVVDVAVFGIPDAEMGESVKAVVEPTDWSKAGPALERQLLAYVRAQLSPLKCPRSIDFDQKLPRHETGKLYKRLIVDRYRV